MGALLGDVVVMPLMLSNCVRFRVSKAPVLDAGRRPPLLSILQPVAGVASSPGKSVVSHCTSRPADSTTIKYRVDALSVVLAGAVKV